MVKGSPFPSRTQASEAIGISRKVISYFLDTGKAEGVRGTYLYTRSLQAKEVKALLKLSQSLELGNKREVWVYDAAKLSLMNGAPFSSLKSAA